MQNRLIIAKEQLQNEKVESMGLVPPIKEFERLELVNRMNLARKLNNEELTEEGIQLKNQTIAKGEKALDELFVIFEPAAMKFAQNWVHNDRINTIDDWHQIIRMALNDAINTYDIKKETQFTTFLNIKVKEYCKANKHLSTLVNTNATAMHKKFKVDQAKEKIEARGDNPDDILLIAAELGRDVSTALKLKNFKEMLYDISQIAISGISTEACVSEGSRTIGEQLESDLVTPYESLLMSNLGKRIKEYFGDLPTTAKNAVKSYLNTGSVKEIKKPSVLKLLKTLEFKELITECRELGVSLADYID